MVIDKYNYLVNFFRGNGLYLYSPEEAHAEAWENMNSCIAVIQTDWALQFNFQGVLVIGSINKKNQKWFIWRTDGSDPAEGYGLHGYYEELTRYGAEILFY